MQITFGLDRRHAHRQFAVMLWRIIANRGA